MFLGKNRVIEEIVRIKTIQLLRVDGIIKYKHLFKYGTSMANSLGHATKPMRGYNPLQPHWKLCDDPVDYRFPLQSFMREMKMNLKY